MKKRLTRLVLIPVILLAAVLATELSGCLSAHADTPYRTYTVDGYGSIVETQTAYLPYETITKIGDESLKGPTDFTLLEDGYMYILDSGHKRVVVSTMDAEPVMTFGEDVFKSPRGIYVTKDHTCYVADRDAKAIFVFDAEGNLVNKYGKPTSAMYGESQDFLPLKIVVNSSGTMYVICESNTNGIVEISPVDGGTFLGYFGTNSTNASIWNIIWRSILTDAQRAKMQSNIPATPDNMAIDDKGLIYTVTRGGGSDSLKRLNIAGVNMIKPDSYESVPAAVAVGNHDNAFVASQNGYIYEYNNEGELLFVFGGSDDGGQRIGLSTKVEAIQISAEDRIYVLDSDKAQIQVYEPTEFTSYLHEALYLFSKGRYEESKEPLSKVLEMNNLFDYANMAMGKAFYKEDNYEKALYYSKLAKDFETYSDAFWEVRNDWVRHNLTWILIVIIALFAAVHVIRVLDKKKHILDGLRNVKKKADDVKIVRQLKFMFRFMKHPIDGCYEIKHNGSASVGSSCILLGVIMIFYVINKYFCGLLFKTVREGNFDVLSDIGMIALIYLVVVACNYLMCTINDGEGRLKHIFCTFVYSMGPYIVLMPFIFALTHVVTFNEKFFVDFGRFAIVVWCAVLIFISIREINNYTVGETIKIIFLTLFTILIVSLLAFIIYVLWSQVFDFLTALPREVVYRIGS